MATPPQPTALVSLYPPYIDRISSDWGPILGHFKTQLPAGRCNNCKSKVCPCHWTQWSVPCLRCIVLDLPGCTFTDFDEWAKVVAAEKAADWQMHPIVPNFPAPLLDEILAAGPPIFALCQSWDIPAGMHGNECDDFLHILLKCKDAGFLMDLWEEARALGRPSFVLNVVYHRIMRRLHFEPQAWDRPLPSFIS
ncbi:hypothetical protein FB45DRAFT_1065858, partial [Roridomyces roridus]